MVQDRTRVSQLSTNTSQPSQNGSGSSAIKKKVVRRDPEKRRMQNRLAQQTYSKLDQINRLISLLILASHVQWLT